MKLKKFLKILEKNGELLVYDRSVSPEYGITEVTLKEEKEKNRAILFTSVENSRFYVVSNLLGSIKRIEYATGRSLNEIRDEVEGYINAIYSKNFFKLLKPAFNALKFFRYRIKKEKYMELNDISQIPKIKHWPLDGGAFITSGVVITKGKTLNFGIYRIQIVDDKTIIIHWQLGKGGGFHFFENKSDVVVAIGGDPLLYFAGALPLPEDVEEVPFIQFLATRYIDFYKKEIPNASFIINATFTGEFLDEGPFGDHFGFYSRIEKFPAYRIKNVLVNQDAIYQTSIVGPPPKEDKAIGEAIQILLMPFIKFIQPEVVKLWSYFEAGFHNLCVVSIKNRFRRECLKVGWGLLGKAQMSLTKTMIFVDENVEPSNWDDVDRAIGENFRVDDFFIYKDTFLDTLDITTPITHKGSKLLIDATAKTLKDNSRGFFFVKTDYENSISTLKMLAESEITENYKIICAIDEDIDMNNKTELLWAAFTRFDPESDVFIHNKKLCINSTIKPFYPPVVSL